MPSKSFEEDINEDLTVESKDNVDEKSEIELEAEEIESSSKDEELEVEVSETLTENNTDDSLDSDIIDEKEIINENVYGIDESDDIETKVTKIFDGLEDEGLEFVRIIDTEKVTIIITKDSEVGKIIGRGGKNVKILSHELHKRVRIIAEHLDLESIAKNILSPARISAISTVYAKDGQKNKIRVLKQDVNKIPGDIVPLTDIIRELSKKEVIVVVE